MSIRNFCDQDIAPAAIMSMSAWQDEMPEEQEAFRLFIYEYIVRYYDRNRLFSFSYTDEDNVTAILLAGFKHDVCICNKWFETECLRFSSREQQIARKYKQYLDYNGSITKSHANRRDLLVNLLISRQRGRGKALLQHLDTVCREHGLCNQYLWSDATCNLTYYARNGFRKVALFYNRILLDDPLGTIIYKRPVMLFNNG